LREWAPALSIAEPSFAVPSALHWETTEAIHAIEAIRWVKHCRRWE
jgi:hypothetical protein